MDQVFLRRSFEAARLFDGSDGNSEASTIHLDD